MEGQEEPDATDQPKDRILHDEETGSHWVVSVAGRSASGILPLRTVPLMELVFADSEAPDHPLRRALRYGADLAGLTDDELLGSLRESDPYSTPMREKQETGKEARRRNDRGARKS
ncbi:MAG: hypothetical protein HKO65_12005 [Gemmatimonadetes bacterium]|nr:hypothetical protein [Gemmatimonadota bacterium]